MTRFTKHMGFIATLIALASVMLEAGAWNFHPQTQQLSFTAQQQVVQEHVSLPPFSAIDAKGNYQILVSGGKMQTIVLIGHPLALQRVIAHVSGNTLVFRTAPLTKAKPYAYNSRVLIRITTPYPLSTITLDGNSQLRAKGVKTNDLSITTYGDASVYFIGRADVQQIQNKGSGIIIIGGIYGRNLFILGAGSGAIRIRGSGNILNVRLRSAASLDAALFKAKVVYVETEDSSLASVQPVLALYAFARDSSNIYYYRVPAQMAGNSEESGNVLKMIK